jgi:hypothetical protein
MMHPRLRTIVAEEKQHLFHILSVCVCVCLCLSVDVVMQHAMHMRRVIRGLSGSTTIFRII